MAYSGQLTLGPFLRVAAEPVLDAQLLQIILDVGFLLQIQRHDAICRT